MTELVEVTPQFEVKFTPSIITIENKVVLDNLVDAAVSKYEGIVATAETIKGAKDSRAELNKLKKALNDKRIEISKEYNAPLSDFEAEIKKYVSKIDDVNGSIDKSIKDFELQEKEEKRVEVLALLAEIANENDVEPNEVEFQDQWLNKTFKGSKLTNSIQESVGKIVKQREFVAEQKSIIANYCKSKDVEPDAFIDRAGQFETTQLMQQIDNAAAVKQARIEREAQRVEYEANEVVRHVASQTPEPIIIEAEPVKKIEVQQVEEQPDEASRVQPASASRIRLIFELTDEQMDSLVEFTRQKGIKVIEAKKIND